ncbi:hypothetical protein L2E82_17230 [Cichorium intybus]|uniref:Uncharacterized protein n=1 Tax=Cichorium intybus TaxID=13427 RepID=A0ACB9F8D8_CICIN|nr:hypothetical protein L2E82_17230 [Cichorium intybus]
MATTTTFKGDFDDHQVHHLPFNCYSRPLKVKSICTYDLESWGNYKEIKKQDKSKPWPIYSSALHVVSGYGGAELIIRVLCPFTKIGRVIGRGASGARVDVDDTRHDECIITISSTESMDDIKYMVVEAVLLLQGKINEEDEENVSFGLIVPSKVIGCTISKSGSIINEIRKIL